MTAARRRWTIATARRQFLALVRLAAREPQHVYRGDRLVAAVLSPELADEVEHLRRPSLAAKLAELQRLCAEENYELMAPARQDRANPLAPSRGGGRSRERLGQKR